MGEGLEVLAIVQLEAVVLDEEFDLPFVFFAQQAAGRVENLAARPDVPDAVLEDISLGVDEVFERLQTELPLDVWVSPDGAGPSSQPRLPEQGTSRMTQSILPAIFTSVFSSLWNWTLDMPLRLILFLASVSADCRMSWT